MIILNLVVFNTEKINDVVSNVLKNKWALNVIVSHAVTSYYMDGYTVQNHSCAHAIQFTTKSLLFTLKPTQSLFLICHLPHFV